MREAPCSSQDGIAKRGANPGAPSLLARNEGKVTVLERWRRAGRRRGGSGVVAGVRVGAGCSGKGGGLHPSVRTLITSTRCWNVRWKLFMTKQ